MSVLDASLLTLASLASVASSAPAALAAPCVTDNRCTTCYMKLDEPSVQWRNVFLCHLPAAWTTSFVAQLFNDVLAMASREARVLKIHRVLSVFLVPRVQPDELGHGFVHMSSHEAACFVVNQLGKSLFETCGAYVGAQMINNTRLYVNLVMEQRDVLEQYVHITHTTHLEQLTQTQREVIATLKTDVEDARKRVQYLEHLLLQMQTQGSKRQKLLPRC